MPKHMLFVLALLPFLAACGVKPGSVEPPSHAKDSPFPRTYPDTATDPG